MGPPHPRRRGGPGGLRAPRYLFFFDRSPGSSPLVFSCLRLRRFTVEIAGGRERGRETIPRRAPCLDQDRRRSRTRLRGVQRKKYKNMFKKKKTIMTMKRILIVKVAILNLADFYCQRPSASPLVRARTRSSVQLG